MSDADRGLAGWSQVRRPVRVRGIRWRRSPGRPAGGPSAGAQAPSDGTESDNDGVVSVGLSNVFRSPVIWLLGAGLLVRLAALPLPGTLDVSVWKIWAFAASTDHPARLYGVGGDPPERRALRYRGRFATVDYPPLALDVLAVAGRVYRAWRPHFPDGPLLSAAVKAPIVLADAMLAGILLALGRRLASEAAGRRLALAYWTMPAVVLAGAALGYLDALAALPAVGALLAGAAGGWGWAGALAAAAALTKVQGVLVWPALAWLAWRRAGTRGLGRWLAGLVLAGATIVAPVALAGALPNLVAALASLARHDMVSGNAANAWWIVTWVFRAWYDLDQGVWAAFTEPVRVLALSTVEELAHVSLRLPATVLAVLAAAWAVWHSGVARRGVDAVPLSHDVARAAALGAWTVHAYFMLGAAVHENHLFLALPYALAASAVITDHVRIARALGAMQALNLFLFYGVSESIGWLPPRSVPLDPTVLLAVAGLVLFAWHARVAARVLRPTPPASPPLC